MKLHNLPTRTNRIFKRIRVGRGPGSGKGMHVVGRGTKGQKSRSGHKSMVMFEGANLPFYKRIPKYRGFKRIQKVENQVVNLDILDQNFENNEEVSIEILKDKGLIRKTSKAVKVLGEGEITKSLKIKNLKISSSAMEKIISAKGEIINDVE